MTNLSTVLFQPVWQPSLLSSHFCQSTGWVPDTGLTIHKIAHSTWVFQFKVQPKHFYVVLQWVITNCKKAFIDPEELCKGLVPYHRFRGHRYVTQGGQFFNNLFIGNHIGYIKDCKVQNKNGMEKDICQWQTSQIIKQLCEPKKILFSIANLKHLYFQVKQENYP